MSRFIVLLVALFTFSVNVAQASTNGDALANAFALAAGEVFAERIINGERATKQCADQWMSEIDFDQLAVLMKYEPSDLPRIMPRLRQAFRTVCK